MRRRTDKCQEVVGWGAYGEVAALHDAGLHVDVWVGGLDLGHGRRAAEVGVDDHHLVLARVAELADHIADGLADLPAHRRLVAAAEVLAVRVLGLGVGLERLHRLGVALLLEVGDGLRHRQRVVPVGGTLRALDPRRHRALGDDSGRPVPDDGVAHRGVESLHVLALRLGDLEAVAGEGLADVPPRHVLSRVARDRHCQPHRLPLSACVVAAAEMSAQGVCAMMG